MQLAVFDIDGTLVTGPSTEKRFFLWLLKTGRLGPRQILASLYFVLRYALRFGPHVLKKNKAYLSGLREDDVRAWAARWAEMALPAVWFAPCVERLRHHLDAGDRVVLLSGSPEFIAAAVARALGVAEFIGTRCVVSQGRFRAAPPLLHPFAGAKVGIVSALAKASGIELERTVAYGDSIYDLPCFLIAGTAVAVRPDSALARVARAEGWEVLGETRQRWLGTLRSLAAGPTASRPLSTGRSRR